MTFPCLVSRLNLEQQLFYRLLHKEKENPCAAYRKVSFFGCHPAGMPQPEVNVSELSDAGMQRRVLMKEYEQQLTIHDTLQIFKAYGVSHVTQQALDQDNPPQLLAALHYVLIQANLVGSTSRELSTSQRLSQ